MKEVRKEGGEVNRMKKKLLFHPFMDEGMSEKKLELTRPVREKAKSWLYNHKIIQN